MRGGGTQEGLRAWHRELHALHHAGATARDLSVLTTVLAIHSNSAGWAQIFMNVQEKHVPPMPVHVNLNQPLQAACVAVETSLHDQPRGKQGQPHGSPGFLGWQKRGHCSPLPQSPCTTARQTPCSKCLCQPRAGDKDPVLRQAGETGMRTFNNWLQKAGLI